MAPLLSSPSIPIGLTALLPFDNSTGAVSCAFPAIFSLYIPRLIVYKSVILSRSCWDVSRNHWVRCNRRLRLLTRPINIFGSIIYLVKNAKKEEDLPLLRLNPLPISMTGGTPHRVCRSRPRIRLQFGNKGALPPLSFICTFTQACMRDCTEPPFMIILLHLWPHRPRAFHS